MARRAFVVPATVHRHSHGVTAWTARVGGSQITDLLDVSGAAASALNAAGVDPLLFSGPADGTGSMWLQLSDAAGLRRKVTADDFPLADSAAAYYTVSAVPASGDATGATDTAAIQAAHDALPSTGGRIHLPGVAYYLNAAVTFMKPVTLTGMGGALTGDAGQATPAAQTTIYVASATVDGLVISGDGSTLSDFAIVNTSGTTPTAGAGIHVTKGDFLRMDRVSVVKFWNNLQVDDGFYYAIRACTFLDPANDGALFTNTTSGESDHGDEVVSDSVFCVFYTTRTPNAAVEWKSGGGLRFVGNKINGGTQPGNASAGKFVYGIRAAVSDGVSTSVLVISGNSIENCTGQGVRITQDGTTGNFSKVVVTGNEIAICGYSVFVDAASTGHISDITVDGNVFTDDSVACYFKNCSGIAVGVNRIVNCPNGGIQFDQGCTDFYMAPQMITGDNRQVFWDNNVGNSGHGPFGQNSLLLQREIPSTTSTSTYTKLWRLTVPQNQAGFMELALGGFIAGKTAFAVKATISYNRATGAVTATTVGTDAVVGTVMDYSFDTATTSGDVIVSVRLNSVALGTDLLGARATLKVDGPIYMVRKGN